METTKTMDNSKKDHNSKSNLKINAINKKPNYQNEKQIKISIWFECSNFKYWHIFCHKLILALTMIQMMI